MKKQDEIKVPSLKYYVETIQDVNGPKMVAMPLDDYHYQTYHKVYHERFTTETCISYLTRLFAPNRRKKTLGKHLGKNDAFCLSACLMNVIALTYSGEHSVQLIYNDEKKTKIPTFYSSLSMAVVDLKPWVDYFLQINTKYVVNHWHVSSKPLNRREILVKAEKHRVNKKFVSNIDIIKNIKKQLISAQSGLQEFSAEHDLPERGTGNIP